MSCRKIHDASWCCNQWKWNLTVTAEPSSVISVNTNQSIKTPSRGQDMLKRCVLCVQVEQLQSELEADRESLRSAESLSTDLMKEKALLEKTLETLRENSERQVQSHKSHQGQSLLVCFSSMTHETHSWLTSPVKMELICYFAETVFVRQ